MNDSLFPEAPAAAEPAADRAAAPFAWYGGKFYYATAIVARFPPHHAYVEPFLGAGNVLFAKQPSDVEIINDLDARIVNFFRVLRERPLYDELVRLATLTPYSRG